MKDLLLYVADADALAFMRSIFQWAQERAGKLGKAVAELKQQQPKELFEHVLRDRLKQTISPRDFDEIGQRASVNALLACESFSAIALTLRTWFPL